MREEKNQVKQRAHLGAQCGMDCLQRTEHKWDVYSWSQGRSLPYSECWHPAGWQWEGQGFIRAHDKRCASESRQIKLCRTAKEGTGVSRA